MFPEAEILPAIAEKEDAVAVSSKTDAAIELMVFQGKTRKEAAEAVGMHDRSLRRALATREGKQYWTECLSQLREGVRPRAIAKMVGLLEAKNETAQFRAAEYLDGMNRGSHTIGATQVNLQINNSVTVETPGYVIKLVRQHEPEQPPID